MSKRVNDIPTVFFKSERVKNMSTKKYEYTWFEKFHELSIWNVSRPLPIAYAISIWT
jgi:hypothetical protein